MFESPFFYVGWPQRCYNEILFPLCTQCVSIYKVLSFCEQSQCDIVYVYINQNNKDEDTVNGYAAINDGIIAVKLCLHYLNNRI
jgi:hypothetical protein